MSMSNDIQASPSPAAPTQRKLWLAIVVGAFAVIGIAYGAYWAIALRYVQTTDDAYVNGNVVQITPQISGTVVAIGADDTQVVKAGRILVQLDQADGKVALDQRNRRHEMPGLLVEPLTGSRGRQVACHGGVPFEPVVGRHRLVDGVPHHLVTEVPLDASRRGDNASVGGPAKPACLIVPGTHILPADTAN